MLLWSLASIACTSPDDPDGRADTSEDTAAAPAPTPHALVSLFHDGNSNGGLALLDGATGETSWELDALPGTDGGTPTPLQVLDAQLSPRGDGLLYFLNDAAAHDGELSVLVEIDRDGAIRRTLPATNGHHSFTAFLDEDGAEVIAYVKSRVDDHPTLDDDIVTDVIVEVAEDGTERVVFDPFTQLAALEVAAEGWISGFYGSTGLDWIHGNHLRWEPARGTYLYNMAVQGAAIRFTRDGGIVAAYLGRDALPEAFLLAPGYDAAPYPIHIGGAFRMQHGPGFDAAGDLWVFDNGDFTAPSSAARHVVQDDPYMLVEAERLYLESVPDVHALVFGGVDAVANGDVWVNFGFESALVAFTAARTTRWEAHFGDDLSIAHVTPTADVEGFLGGDP